MLRKEEANGCVVLQKQPFMRGRNDAVRCYVKLEPIGAGSRLTVEFSPPKRYALLLKAWAILLFVSIAIQYPWLLSNARKEDPVGAAFMAFAIPIVAMGWMYIAFGYRLELRQRFFLNFLKRFLKTY
jgi:hypothetical protein